jgi:hypothetical protein
MRWIWIPSRNHQTARVESPKRDSGETELSPMVNSVRGHMFFEAYASSGTYGIDTTIDSAVSNFHVVAFLEPAGGGLLLRRRRGN